MQTWLLRGRKLKHNSTSCTTHLPVLRQGCPMTADQWLRLWSEHLSVFQILKWFQSTISNLKTITCVKESQLLPVKFIGRFDLWARGHFLFVFFFFIIVTKAVRVTKPKIPESIRRNFELMWVCKSVLTSTVLVHFSDSFLLSTHSVQLRWHIEKYLEELFLRVFVQGSREDSSVDNSSDSEGGGKGSRDWKEEGHYW